MTVFRCLHDIYLSAGGRTGGAAPALAPPRPLACLRALPIALLLRRVPTAPLALVALLVLLLVLALALVALPLLLALLLG